MQVNKKLFEKQIIEPEGFLPEKGAICKKLLTYICILLLLRARKKVAINSEQRDLKGCNLSVKGNL